MCWRCVGVWPTQTCVTLCWSQHTADTHQHTSTRCQHTAESLLAWHTCVGRVLDMCSMCVGRVLDVCWTCVGDVLAVFILSSSRSVCWTCVGRVELY